MAICRPVYGGFMDLVLPTGVASQANNAVHAAGWWDNNEVAAFDLRLFISIKTGATIVSPGTYDILMASSVDGITYSDGIPYTSCSNGILTGYTLKNTPIVKSIIIDTAATTYTWEGSIGDVVPSLPRFFAMFLRNNTGGPMSSGVLDHKIKIMPVAYEYL